MIVAINIQTKNGIKQKEMSFFSEFPFVAIGRDQ